MPEPNAIVALLREAEQLLREHHATDWADTLAQILQDGERDPNRLADDVRSDFGGMNSLNDLVLHDESGKPRLEANERLDALRRELWVVTARD